MEDRVIQVFKNKKFGKIRIVIIDGRPWFVAVDICKALEIKNSRDAVSRLDEDEKKIVDLNTVDNADANNGATSDGWIKNEVNVVNEPGLYRLIFSSRKPEAKEFQRWVYHEVLPSIMSTGAYISPNAEVISDSAEETLSLKEKIACLLKCAELTNLARLRNQFLREAAFISVGKKFY